MHVNQLVKSITEKLLVVYEQPETAALNAWWILETITKTTKPALLVSKEISLTSEQQQQLESWLHALLHAQKPLQYLIGEVPFLQLTIAVTPPILIPRPETEAWCAQLIETFNNKRHPRLILDLCTGSGCIAIALARAFPASTVYAIDIHSFALEQAQSNATRNRVNNIVLVQSNLFEAVPPLKFDLIVSNPPYISIAEWQQLEPCVKLWEDRQALVAENNGLELIENIIHRAPDFLAPAAPLWIEIGYQQGNAVKKLLENRGFGKVEIIQDLQGHPRVATAFLQS